MFAIHTDESMRMNELTISVSTVRFHWIDKKCYIQKSAEEPIFV